jgi:hypothetical protein
VESFAYASNQLSSSVSSGGVAHLPSENGFVLKYMPGRQNELEARHRMFESMSGEDMQEVLRETVAISSDSRMTFGDAQAKISALIRAKASDASPKTASQPSAGRSPSP